MTTSATQAALLVTCVSEAWDTERGLAGLVSPNQRGGTKGLLRPPAKPTVRALRPSVDATCFELS